jgi:hypothetical protein
MTALVPTIVSRLAGVDNTVALTAATGADTFPAGPNTYLRVKNGNAAPCVVSVTPTAGGGPLQTTVAPLTLTPSVAATTGDRTYGPFPQNPFGDSNGNVNVVTAPFATVTIGAFIYPGA